VYLSKEEEWKKESRKKTGGSHKQRYKEGWIEFEDKNVAKQIAFSHNGQAMGGNRRAMYASDLWTLRYLPKFKWDHLNEKFEYDRKVRD
jgi:ESF2/ABP1 family protein